MLHRCVTWSSRAYRNDTLRRAHYSFLTRYIGWRNNKRPDHLISCLDTLMKTGRENTEVIMRRRRTLVAGFVARMEETRSRDCRSA